MVIREEYILHEGSVPTNMTAKDVENYIKREMLKKAALAMDKLDLINVRTTCVDSLEDPLLLELHINVISDINIRILLSYIKTLLSEKRIHEHEAKFMLSLLLE